MHPPALMAPSPHLHPIAGTNWEPATEFVIDALLTQKFQILNFQQNVFLSFLCQPVKLEQGLILLNVNEVGSHGPSLPCLELNYTSFYFKSI